MSKQSDQCARRFPHVWAQEPVKQTRTHLLKQCERCKGVKWVPRRDS